jgi:hypothetical protein
MQLVGQTCVRCAARLTIAIESVGCPRCGRPFHQRCVAGHDCVERPAPLEVVSTPAPRSKARIWGPIAGVVFAASLSPFLSRSREATLVRERAARDLRCAVDQVQVKKAGNFVMAEGCGDKAEYFISCRPLSREACMTMTEYPQGAVTDMIDRRLRGR